MYYVEEMEFPNFQILEFENFTKIQHVLCWGFLLKYEKLEKINQIFF